MKKILTITLILCMSACIPDKIKETMDTEMFNAQKMMADSDFQNTIAQIELHKLRYGHYPDSLSDLKFIPPTNTNMFHSVDYTRLDSVYELNTKATFTSIDGKKTTAINLYYSPGFWKGLGCAKSNAKNLPIKKS